MDVIKIGDIVNVFFENADPLASVEVLHDANQLDYWILKEENGTIHNVKMFSKMTKLK